MTIKVGDQLPKATFMIMAAEGPEPCDSDKIFKGKKIVLVAIPGAFTPTCSLNHLPGYINEANAIMENGVDAIAVTAVNDIFVLDAWAKQSGGKDKAIFLADGNGDFAKAIGLTFDASVSGMGTRSLRYSMLVDDGIVKILNIEENPGKATISDAGHMLDALQKG